MILGQVAGRAVSHDARREPGLCGLELLACWEALGLGPLPTLLPLFSPAASHAERAAKRGRAIGELTRRGLADGRLPHPTLAAALAVVARPERWLDLRWVAGPDRMRLALGAVAGCRGVILSTTSGNDRNTDADPYELRVLDAGHVPAAMLELLGPLRRGTGTPVNIPAGLLDQAREGVPPDDLWAVADRLQVGGVARGDAVALIRMVGGVLAGGQLGVTWRVDDQERRASRAVGFHRTEHGWFSLTRCGSEASGEVLTVAPTDAAGLRRLWSELADHTVPAGLGCPPTSGGSWH